MNDNKVATRYAKALFELAEEQNALDAVAEDMRDIQALTKENKEFRRLLDSPVIRGKKKEEIFRELFGKTYHGLSMQFLFLLLRNKRENYLKNIVLHFLDYQRKKQGIVDAQITTATPLEEKAISKMRKEIGKILHAEIAFHEKVDESLVGGFILRFDDKQMDASIRKQLNQIRRKLLQSE